MTEEEEEEVMERKRKQREERRESWDQNKQQFNIQGLLHVVKSNNDQDLSAT